jgi:DNA-binding response OmpR family regulator
MSICVLIADPDTAVLNRYREALRREGVEVLTAASASECMERLDDRSPDAYVLDPELPCCGLDDALSFLSRLLGDEVPVILVSREPEADAEIFPVWRCYAKPLSPAALADVLRELPAAT